MINNFDKELKGLDVFSVRECILKYYPGAKVQRKNNVFYVTTRLGNKFKCAPSIIKPYPHMYRKVVFKLTRKDLYLKIFDELVDEGIIEPNNCNFSDEYQMKRFFVKTLDYVLQDYHILSMLKELK